MLSNFLPEIERFPFNIQYRRPMAASYAWSSRTFQITKTFHVAMLQRYKGFWDSGVWVEGMPYSNWFRTSIELYIAKLLLQLGLPNL